MNNYKVTFGKAKDKITVIEKECCNFSEVVARLEYSGFDCTQITKIERSLTKLWA